MNNNQNNQETKYKSIYDLQEYTRKRIKELEKIINSINNKLLDLEIILDDINQKINDPNYNNKTVTKSRLMRWYIEDIKIYNELNTIRINYENALSKYLNQLFDSEYKMHELEIKYSKLNESENDIQEIFEKINEQLKQLELKSVVDNNENNNDSTDNDSNTKINVIDNIEMDKRYSI